MGNAKQSKKSKKYILLAIFMALLMGVITTGSITFAKYVILQTVGSRHANVAKWGFFIDVDASNLFSDAYDHSIKVSYDESSIDVKANSENTNIVAPGTSGYLTFTIGGTAEVYSKLEIRVSENPSDIYLEEKTDSGDTQIYYPVKWTLKKDGAEVLKDVTLNAIVDGLKEYSIEEIKPGEKPDSAGTYAIEWRWDLDDGDGINQKDTVIGQIANGAQFEKYKASTVIEFGLRISFEQIRSPEKRTA